MTLKNKTIKVHLTTALLIPAIFFSFISCNKNKCFEDEGRIISQKLQVEPFTRIELNDNINLVLTQDTISSAIIEAGENILPLLEIKTNNNKLEVSNKAGCTWLRKPGRKINLYLHVTSLSNIIYSGLGNISCTNRLVADSFNITSAEGAGNVEINIAARRIFTSITRESASFTFKGTCDYAVAFCNVLGQLNMEQLQIRHLDLKHSSVHDINVHVTQRLEGILYHTGNARVKGNPSIVTVETRSTGRVINF
jgi:hypothetical protein